MIGGFLERLHLYTLAAQLAVLNQSLHQAEAMISAALRLTGDIPKQEEINGNQVSTEGPLLAFAKSMVGVLVVMPGHPDKGLGGRAFFCFCFCFFLFFFLFF